MNMIMTTIWAILAELAGVHEMAGVVGAYWKEITR